MKPVLLIIIFILQSACGADPFIQALSREDDDRRASRMITVTNDSAYEIAVCAQFSACFFTVAPGTTGSGTIKFDKYDESADNQPISVSIQRTGDRQVFSYTGSWNELFREEGAEVRWAGNFSGVHSFQISTELSNLVSNNENPGSYYRYSKESLTRISLALNDLDQNWKLREYYGSDIEITAPPHDTVLYFGTRNAAGTPAPADGNSFVKDGWIFSRLDGSSSSQLFNNYTKSTNFTCRTGGCFEIQ
jgi:hypothetical protein